MVLGYYAWMCHFISAERRRWFRSERALSLQDVLASPWVKSLSRLPFEGQHRRLLPRLIARCLCGYDKEREDGLSHGGGFNGPRSRLRQYPPDKSLKQFHLKEVDPVLA